jgi:peptidoglycan/LPS O-acetylase OafA/YrhL
MASLTLQIPAAGERRLAAMDELKGLAILLVVLYHAGGTLVWRNFLHGDIGVDMFVIVSGIGLTLGRPVTNVREFLHRRVLRIMPAYWIALTACWIINTSLLDRSYTAGDIGLHYLGLHTFFGDRYAFGFNDSFWYISLILLLYACHAALQAWINRPDRVLLAGAILSTGLALGYFFAGQSVVFGHLGLRAPGFFLGIFIGQLIQSGRLELPCSRLTALALLVLAYVPYTQGVVFHTFVVGAVLMFAYVTGFRPTRFGPPVGRGLSFLGRHSLEIFLLHQPLIRDYPLYWLGRSGVTQPTATQLLPLMLIGLAVALVLSIELHRVLGKMPWSRPARGN